MSTLELQRHNIGYFPQTLTRTHQAARKACLTGMQAEMWFTFQSTASWEVQMFYCVGSTSDWALYGLP